MDSFDQKPDKETPDYEDAAKGTNDVSSVISVGVLQRRLLSGQVNRQEGDNEASYV